MTEVLTMDPLAARIQELAKHSLVALSPVLAELERLRADADRQFDPAMAAAVMALRERVFAGLELGVENGRWLSVREAANRARRPESTVRYWCRKGHVVARKVGVRDWEIDRASLIKRAAA